MRFEAQGELGVAEGSPATLIVKELATPFASSGMRFSAREATLRLDLSWLLTAQSKRLDELAHGGPGFDAAAALTVVTPERGRVPAARGKLPARELDGLNVGQRNAVELALAPTLTWLWGPPGTGKTTTVSALIATLSRRGKRVLLRDGAGGRDGLDGGETGRLRHTSPASRVRRQGRQADEVRPLPASTRWAAGKPATRSSRSSRRQRESDDVAEDRDHLDLDRRSTNSRCA